MSPQLYRRYLEHYDEEEGDEALKELRRSMQLYNCYLEHLGEEGNETRGRSQQLYQPLLLGPIKRPTPLTQDGFPIVQNSLTKSSQRKPLYY